MDAPAAVIVNGATGGMDDPEMRQRLTRLIEESCAGATVTFTEKGSDPADLAKKAFEQGFKVIVAGGGDGTVGSIASVLAGSGAVLGVLPLGTFNHFAKDLGIPVDLEAAVQTLATGVVTEVDVGQVNKRTFINNSSLGLYAAIVRHRERKQGEGQSKRMAALSALVKALEEYRLFTVNVVVSGQQIIRETPIVFVGNNHYTMAGLEAGSRSRLDAGHLSLVIPHSRGRLGLFWFSLIALLGREHRAGDLDIILAKDFRIESAHRRLEITLDGEVEHMDVPLHYHILPKALRVIAPAAVQ